MSVYLTLFFKLLCRFFSLNTKINNLCVSSQQTTSSELLTIPRQQVIYGRRDSKNKINKLTVTSRAISFRPSSNKIPPSPPHIVGIKRKVVLE